MTLKIDRLVGAFALYFACADRQWVGASAVRTTAGSTLICIGRGVAVPAPT